MNLNSKIYIAGHTGLVGSALLRKLKSENYSNIVTQTHSELDLTNQAIVENFFQKEKPEYVILAAAKVGGIYSNNNYPAEFIYSNLSIQTNVIHQAYLSNVKRLLFLGSSCIYPCESLQPIKEEYLLTGPLEATNRPYALAKIAGVEMCWSYNRQYGTNFLSIMPTNLYGEGDNYHPKNSHVIPGMIYKFHEAKIKKHSSVILWGTGNPRREFLYVDDMAEAIIFIMNLEDQTFNSLLASERNNGLPPTLNLGANFDISINNLAYLIKDVVDFKGEIIFDSEKPDGTMSKLMDSSRLNKLGWIPKISLEDGLKKTYQNFKISNRKS